jgi:hypothetical protein
MPPLYRLTPELDNHETLRAINAADREFLGSLTCGEPFESRSTAIVVEPVTNRGSTADFHRLTTPNICCSDRAWSSLSPLIESDVQTIELRHSSGAKYYVIHPLAVFDALDRERSHTAYNPILEDISCVHNAVLKASSLGKSNLFEIPEFAGVGFFVTEVVKDAIESHGLTGAVLKNVDLV